MELWNIILKKEVCYKWFDCLYKMDTHKEMWSLSGSERHSTIDKAFMWKENLRFLVVI